MGPWITVTAALEVPYPPQDALEAIWEIKNIERCEVKADRVDVHPLGPRRGTYDVSGRFAGLPWHGRFEYELDDRGFHSRTADVPRRETKVEGGFVVTPLGESGSTVIHYEQYVLARWLRPFGSLVRVYLRRSMRRELRDLRDLIASTAPVPQPGEPARQ